MRPLSALALSLPLLAALPAAAYVRTTTDKGAAVRWPRSCVTMLARSASPPLNLTPDLVVTAARAAAAVWNRESLSCSSFELSIENSDTSDAPTAHDKVNNLVFRKSRWDYDASALAITTVFAQQVDGVILDADVELNAVAGGRFKWGDLVAGIGTEGGAEDLQNTLTHEFGHLLGLDHNCFLVGSNNRVRAVDHEGVPVPDCDGASAVVQEATMFAAVMKGDTVRRTLAADDIAGVCAIYPASAERCGGDTGGGGGGCSLARARRSTGALALLPLALGAVLVSARRRRRPPRG